MNESNMVIVGMMVFLSVVAAGASYSNYQEKRARETYCLSLAKAGQDIKQIPKCMEK